MFQQMWTTHDDFWRLAAVVWQQKDSGSGFLKLVSKLKRLKVALRRWNREVFGWTGDHIKRLEERLAEGSRRLQEQYSKDIESDVLASQVELTSWLKKEEVRIAKKLKQTWINHGEVSLSFFVALQAKKHNVVKEMHLSDG